MSRLGALVGLAGLAAIPAAYRLVPSVTALAPVRLALAPGLSGVGVAGHVAVTFDDGPDPASTPQFLDVLAEHDVRATFFVLGTQLAQHPELGREALARGHELGVHGWTHRCHLARSARDLHADLGRSTAYVEDLTGVRPRFWRPPYGIATGPGLWTAHRLGLRPVLWTAWGKDWTADATASSVSARVLRTVRGGGTVLLHDADTTSAPESWRATLAALPTILRGLSERGWQAGTLSEHVAR